MIFVGDKIGLCGRGWADEHRLVGHLHSHRVGVSLRIDNHRGDPHSATGLAMMRTADFPAIGDQGSLKTSKPRTLLLTSEPKAGTLD